MNIILIGFMGSGKTAVGQELARQLKLKYLDTDILIEKSGGKKISEIFAQKGEEHFRKLETEVVKALEDYDGFVVSTGGGIVLKEENVKMLKKAGPLVLLWAEPEAVIKRIGHQRHRPLLAVDDPAAEAKKILGQRKPIYQKAADFTVDTSNLKIEEVVSEIIKWLKSR